MSSRTEYYVSYRITSVGKTHLETIGKFKNEAIKHAHWRKRSGFFDVRIGIRHIEEELLPEELLLKFVLD